MRAWLILLFYIVIHICFVKKTSKNFKTQNQSKLPPPFLHFSNSPMIPTLPTIKDPRVTIM